MNRHRSSIRHTIRRASVVVAALIASATILAAPVAAHPRHGKHHGAKPGHHARIEHRNHAGPTYQWRHRQVAPPRFAVPRVIRHADSYGYRPYYQRSVYDRTHHHRHVVYRFPVYLGGVTRYESFVYCDGALFDGPSGFVGYDGPRVSFRVHF